MTLASIADAIVASIGPDISKRLAADPIGAMTTQFGLTLREAPTIRERRGSEGWCDGVSFLNDLVVLIAATGTRRDHFTALHELGHFLVRRDDPAMDWLADHPNPGQAEEALSDQFAARLLIPASMVDDVLNAGQPRAEHLTELHRRSQASEPACAIALSQRLPCQGAVIITEARTNTVYFASVNPAGDGWPQVYPWRGQPVPDGHPLRRIRSGQYRRERSWWAAPWGDRQTYYLDTTTSTNRAHTVLAVHDLWDVTTFHGGDEARTSDRPEALYRCPCGFNGTARGYPCDTCGEPYCPDCRRCRCDRQLGRMVDCPNPNCYMKVFPHQIRKGHCVNCE